MAIRGQFPPQFESDRQYTEEYNLEQLNVYLDAPPGVYFDIKGLPENLSLGKHYITISFKEPNPNDDGKIDYKNEKYIQTINLYVF